MNKSHLRIAYNQAKDELTIDVEGVIGQDYDWWTGQKGTTKEMVAEKLKEIANSRASHIIVNINSYGGDVNHGISIHDLLSEHKAKVTTVIHGHTASAATIISQAGDTRKMSDNSLFLVHRAMMIGLGNVHDMELALNDLTKIDQTISNIYAKRNQKTQQEMLSVMDRNNGQGEWLTAQEAKDLGFIDEIYEPMKAVAMVTPGTFKAMGLPEIPQEKLKNTDMKADKKTVSDWFNEFISSRFGRKLDNLAEPPKAEGEPAAEPDSGPPAADPAPEPAPKADPTPEPPAEPAAEPQPTNEVVLKDLKEIQDALADLAAQNEAKAAEIVVLKTNLQNTKDELIKVKAGPTATWPKDDPVMDASNIKTNEANAEANAAALRGEK